MTSPLPRDMGANGSQLEGAGKAGVSGTEGGAGSFAAMCGMDARLNLKMNFTGARPAGNGCDCDFRTQVSEIDGYPNGVYAANQPVKNPKYAASQPVKRTSPPARRRPVRASSRRGRRHAAAARLEAGYQRARAAGTAHRSMPRTSLYWSALVLGGMAFGGAGLALRRVCRPRLTGETADGRG